VAEQDRGVGLRERTRRAVRTEISSIGMRLFLQQGFDNTSVEQIAAGVGIPSRSFFRYFGTKEDVVLGNLAEAGLALQAALRARPAGEDPWTALRAACGVLMIATMDDLEASRRMSRMLLETPSLRARHLEKQLQWQTLLVPDIQERLGPAPHQPDSRAAALVAAALSCLDAATAAWGQSDADTPLAVLLDDAIAAVRN
jgi:AcrR family transcriptional regulator